MARQATRTRFVLHIRSHLLQSAQYSEMALRGECYGWCRQGPTLNDGFPQVYLWTALFDLIVLCLTLSATLNLRKLSLADARLRSMVMSKITKQFLTDAGLYFAGSFSPNIAIRSMTDDGCSS